jgi:prepilin-type N-terminal cleavage/methylation domain-containing protein
MKSVRKAFTLVELLIVIAIIGILAAVILISLNTARLKAQDTQVKSDVSSLAKALEIVRVDRNLTATSGWMAVVKNTSTTDDSNVSRWTDGGLTNPTDAVGVGKELVPKVPTSPISGGTYSIRFGSTGYAIISKLNGTNNWYCSLNGNNTIITGQNESTARTTCATGI